MYIDKEKIRRIRREKEFSQEYMAEVLGLSQSQYSRIESGESSIDLDKIKSISDVLEINPLEIIEFSDKQSFVNCNQSGNINTINNHDKDLFEKERMSYLQQIEELKNDKEFLIEELASLRKIIEGLLEK